MSKQSDTTGAPGSILDGPPGAAARPESGRGSVPGARQRLENGPENGPGNGTETDPAIAVCDHPDCQESGEFRAPRSRMELTRSYWFCLEHVREYNAAWNYYADMDDAA
ncbi:unnamed protein product, partial [Laminaria digitata]